MTPSSSGLKRVEHWVVRVRPFRELLATLRLYRQRQGGARTAEIAYYSVLSLIPFGMLLLTSLGYIMENLLSMGWETTDLHNTVADFTRAVLPGADVDAVMEFLMQDRSGLGHWGLVVAFVTASLVFGAVNRSLAAIFDVRRKGRLRSTLNFGLFLGALTLLFVGTVDSIVFWTSQYAAERSQSQHLLAGGSGWYEVLVALVLGLTFVFLLLTSVRKEISIRHAFWGGCLFVGLFELARAIFGLYLGTVSQLNLIYGSLGGIVVAVLWVYYAALTLLIAMCFVCVRQDGLALGRMGDWHSAEKDLESVASWRHHDAEDLSGGDD